MKSKIIAFLVLVIIYLSICVYANHKAVKRLERYYMTPITDFEGMSPEKREAVMRR